MSTMNFSRCILLILLSATCTRIVYGKGGRGGGFRGGWGRSSSSRSSSSSRGSSSSSHSFSLPKVHHSYPDINKQREQVKEAVAAHHSANNFQRYTPPEIPNLQAINALVNERRSQVNEAVAAHQRVANYRNSRLSAANYPRQNFGNKPVYYNPSSRQGPRSNANSPRPPITFRVIPRSHSSFPKPGVSSANYPRQPSPQQVIVPSAPYTFQAIPHANYPRQQNSQPNKASGLLSHPQSGIASANYPRQQFNHQSLTPQVLGSGVWNPKSGMPAPVYMNYGGLPTGANMYTKPMKKQGFLGSLMSMGGSSKSFKNKHYSSYPSPYGLGGGMSSNVMGGFMGNKGSKAAMYTILPYMAARKSSKLFKPKFGFYSYMPMRHHYYHHHSFMHEPEYARVYDVYNNEYVGRCNRPIKPDHAKVIVCNSTHNQVECEVTCEEGYRYPDNTTRKTNKCWHVSGTWSPTKNFPGCKLVCDQPCMNGGNCVSPGVCSCPSEYRGPRCESHFLNCDIRKLANGTKIRWVCSHTKNETTCRVRCKSPAQFVPRSSESTIFKCTPGGVWTPSTMPLCVMPPGPEEQNVTKVPEEQNVTKVPEEQNVTKVSEEQNVTKIPEEHDTKVTA